MNEHASGETVSPTFNPAAFDFGNGGDVVEPFPGRSVLQAAVDVAVEVIGIGDRPVGGDVATFVTFRTEENRTPSVLCPPGGPLSKNTTALWDPMIPRGA